MRRIFATALSILAAGCLLVACNAEVKPQPLERISFLELLSSPEDFSNRKVAFVGYVDIDNGSLTAYASRDSYRARDDRASVVLQLPFDEEVRLAEQFKGHYCWIVGVFVMETDQRPHVLRMGRIESPDIRAETDYSRSEDKGSNEIMIKIPMPSRK